ncbi:SPW repeat protein [Alicyclobacillus sp. ALC3]|uniref:SPW repeat protein n=1 Tax=Alicyclobacillus sp. ALC3 TaxID=2796143 RepID=UPI002378016B|nr:SPW repeat protein [Alicyclobacillus sp. ALC3]WDL98333.1 SPW repeat protein [Alicyclobacillus sp. ALC3]
MDWRHWLNAIVGAWFIVAPWVLGLTHLNTATWFSMVIGAVQVVAAVWGSLWMPAASWRSVPDWITLVTGFWFLVHPFLGHFEDWQYFGTIVPALATMVLSLWTLMMHSGSMGNRAGRI